MTESLVIIVEHFHDNQHDTNLWNLKTAEDGATVGDGANGTGKSQQANGGQDVAVDELPGVEGDDYDGDGNDEDGMNENEWQGEWMHEPWRQLAGKI